MEAKRIKLDSEEENSRDSLSQTSVSSMDSIHSPVDLTLDQLRSSDPSVLEKALLNLKSTLRSRSAIEQFIDSESLQRFYLVTDVLAKAATDITNKTPPWLSILKESTSLIANCCHYSITACMKMTSSKIGFASIAVRVFESGSLRHDCKTSMARLVANMCAHKEPAMCVASNTSLVDRLVLLLDSDESSATQALRAIRGLVASNYIKPASEDKAAAEYAAVIREL
ncbi:hypothetical protein RB195_006198 [Necator americanus]|uniref:Uncharacterized protein n=1 Tax=Necator americanus TaxID=51031 RepID=A0ABR1BUH3_NECAM